MVYKVLSALTGAVLGIMAVVFVVCFGYTMSSPTVQQGIQDIRNGVGGMVDTAMESMDSEWGFDLGGLWDDAVQAVSGSLPSAGSEGDTRGFADPAQGEAYLGWSSAIEDPMAKVFGESGVTESLVEGVAAGSVSATGELVALDPSSLAGIASSAASYAASAGVNFVPSTLPDDARAYMDQANGDAREFADAALDMVSAARSLQAGDVLAAADLADGADRVLRALSSLRNNMASAEKLLS